jgi:hypothetical protein
MSSTVAARLTVRAGVLLSMRAVRLSMRAGVPTAPENNLLKFIVVVIVMMV